MKYRQSRLAAITFLVFIFSVCKAQSFYSPDTLEQKRLSKLNLQATAWGSSTALPAHVYNKFLFGGRIDNQSIAWVNESKGLQRAGAEAGVDLRYTWRDSLYKRTHFVQYSEQVVAGARYPAELVQLALNGNLYFENQALQLSDTYASSYSWRSISYGRTFKKGRFTYSPSLGIASLNSFSQLNIQSATLLSTSDSISYSFEYQSERNSSNKFSKSGIAPFLGLNISYSKNKWLVMVDVQNVGIALNSIPSITEKYVADTTFKGFRVNDINSLSLLNVEDSLNSLANKNLINERKSALTLPARFTFKAYYTLRKAKNTWQLFAGSFYISQVFQAPSLFLGSSFENRSLYTELAVYRSPFQSVDASLRLGFNALQNKGKVILGFPALSGLFNSKRFYNTGLHLQLVYQW